MRHQVQGQPRHAVHDHQDGPRQRDGRAQPLPEGQPLAQHEGRQEDQRQGLHRDQERGIGRRRALQAEVEGGEGHREAQGAHGGQPEPVAGAGARADRSRPARPGGGPGSGRPAPPGGGPASPAGRVEGEAGGGVGGGVDDVADHQDQFGGRHRAGAYQPPGPGPAGNRRPLRPVQPTPTHAQRHVAPPGPSATLARCPGILPVGERPPEASSDLLARLRQGEPQAFEDLVIAHQHRVYGLALRMLGRPAEAEDVAQEVFPPRPPGAGRLPGGRSACRPGSTPSPPASA